MLSIKYFSLYSVNVQCEGFAKLTFFTTTHVVQGEFPRGTEADAVGVAGPGEEVTRLVAADKLGQCGNAIRRG